MKKCRFPSLLAAVILLAALFLPMSAAAVEDPGLTCRNAILIDATYDEVLYDKGAYDKVYPASITKVMTALLVLEAVDAGQLTLDTPITATAEALEVPEGGQLHRQNSGGRYLHPGAVPVLPAPPLGQRGGPDPGHCGGRERGGICGPHESAGGGAGL